MPGVGKKADAVADRSGVPLLYNHASLHQGSPTRRERRHAFPGSQVFGTGTLPVGFQGRSALVAPKGAKSRFKKLVHGAKSLFLCFFAPRTVKMRGRCYISFMIISMSECEEMISAYD